MARLRRCTQRSGPLPFVPLIARRVSANHAQICDAGHCSRPYGVALDAPEILLHGLPFHLAESRAGGTGTRSARLALRLEVLASRARRQAERASGCSKSRRSAGVRLSSAVGFGRLALVNAASSRKR